MVKSKDADKRAAQWREAALALPTGDAPNLSGPDAQRAPSVTAGEIAADSS